MIAASLIAALEALSPELLPELENFVSALLTGNSGNAKIHAEALAAHAAIGAAARALSAAKGS